jgi:hypothetical protein
VRGACAAFSPKYQSQLGRLQRYFWTGGGGRGCAQTTAGICKGHGGAREPNYDRNSVVCGISAQTVMCIAEAMATVVVINSHLYGRLIGTRYLSVAWRPPSEYCSPWRQTSTDTRRGQAHTWYIWYSLPTRSVPPWSRRPPSDAYRTVRPGYLAYVFRSHLGGAFSRS